MKKNKKETEEIEVLDLDIEEENNSVESEPKINIFTRLKESISDLSTKTKAIIIIVSVIISLVIICLFLYIYMQKNENKTNNQKQVVVAKDNYRYEDGVLYFVVNSKDIGSYKCKNKDEKLCYVAYENNDDEFDVTYIKKDKLRSKIIKNKYVFIFDNEKEEDNNIILYNIKSSKDIGVYTSIKTYDKLDNIVFAKNLDEKYGVLDFSEGVNKIKIEFDYNYLGIVTEDKDINEEVIVANQTDGYSLIDYEGKTLSKKLNGAINNYNKKYIKTMDATKAYNIYDYEGKKIVDGYKDSYKYIDLLDDYYLAVDKDNKLKIYDYENNKYLEDGIALYNDNYVKKIIKNGSIETNDFAYEYVLDNTYLTLKVKTDTDIEEHKINLLDGLLSKGLKYINYFNGTLYFYKEENKENLINSYKCNKPNQLTKDNMKLETCFLASDTIENDNDINDSTTAASVVPIINQRYVFIKDDNIINLVDLIDEKIIGTYLSINSSSNNTQTEAYNLDVVEQYVFAKNKNNKYGLLKLTKNGATSVYNFEYDKLQRMNKYILANKDKKYYLLDYNGNRITYEYTSAIRNYMAEYVKLFTKDKYYVYDFDGNIVIDKGYNYIELYDTYVALVDENNKLMLVDYKGNKIINDTIKLSSTTYYRAKEGYVPAFTITKNENKLIIICATSQDTKKEDALELIYDLTTKKRVNK